MSLAASIRQEVARALDQLRWLAARDDALSRHALPFARNRLALLIADHAVVCRGMR